MAEGSRYASYFAAEPSSGVTPLVMAFDIFRATKSGLDINITALQSAEIRNDAEVADFRLGTRHVEGTANGELSFGTFDPLIAAALRGSWSSDVVVGGIQRPTFTFIDYNADISDLPYTVYRGCEINTMGLGISAAAMTTVQFGIVGRTMEQMAQLPAGWTIKPRTASSPMDGFSGALLSNGQKINVITEMAINIENGIEPRFVIGSKFSITPSTKRRNVTGTMTAYFEDNSLRLAYLNELEQQIVLSVSDGNSGNTYEISLPRVKFTEAPRPVDGEGDIMQNLSYRALLDPVTSNSVKITRKLVVPAPTGVIVTPAQVDTVNAGQTQQFTAVVTGTTNQAVTWDVNPSGNGTVSNTGLFTAASSGASGNTTVTARTVANPLITGVGRISAITIPALTSYLFAMDASTVTKGTVTGSAPTQTLTIAAFGNGKQVLSLSAVPGAASIGTPAVKTGAVGSAVNAAIAAGKLEITPKAAGTNDVVITDGQGNDTLLHVIVSA